MTMSASWILDIIIKDGDFSSIPEEIDTAIWFVISADGLQNPFSTVQTTISKNPVWNYPSRLVLHFHDITRAYLYLTLCSYEYNGQGVQAIARSRVGLRYLPIGNPKQFRFPLMHARNAANTIMSLRVVATLSSFAPQMQLIRNSPLPQSEGVFGSNDSGNQKNAPFSNEY